MYISKISIIISLALLSSCQESPSGSAPNQKSNNNFKPIYFKKNSAEIPNKYYSRLDSVGTYLIEHPDCDFQAFGCAHPSEIGYKNDSLAFERASIIYDYLEENFDIPRPQLIGTTVIGPALGQGNEDFKAPPEFEFRKATIEIEDCPK